VLALPLPNLIPGSVNFDTKLCGERSNGGTAITTHDRRKCCCSRGALKLLKSRIHAKDIGSHLVAIRFKILALRFLAIDLPENLTLDFSQNSALLRIVFRFVHIYGLLAFDGARLSGAESP